MIAPTEADIGRKVVYRDPYAEVGMRGRASGQEGVITGLSKIGVSAPGGGVFVRYGGSTTSQLTPVDRLEWLS